MTQFLWDLSNGGTWLLPLVGAAALIDSINPCAFSILLLTIAFLFSVGSLRSGILKIGGTYILGIFAVYFLIGLGLIQTLHLFDTPHFMAKLGASLLILLGLTEVLGEIFPASPAGGPAFPIRFKIPSRVHSKMAELMSRASLPAAFGLGALVGVCEFPCTGGPYLAVLGLLHDSATYWKGFGYLVLYNLIFVLPLILILFLASSAARLKKIQEWQRAEKGRVRFWGGMAMILLGIVIFSL